MDAFGTLVSMEPPAPHLGRELREAGIAVSDERAEASFRAEISYYLTHHLEGRDPRSLDELRDRCAQVVMDELGVEGLDRDEVRRAMLASIRFFAFDDAPTALRALRERSLKLAVAGNWDATLPHVLSEVGLAGLVDAVLSSAELGVAKPDPAFFEQALAAIDCPRQRAIYVGDSPANDVEAAARAGLRAVLLRRPGKRLDERPAERQIEGEPYAEIERLTDLLSLI